MDNVTHTLFGLALARGGLDRTGRWVTPTLLVASNLPDLDGIGAFFWGKPWYLVHHRGLSHAILGIAVQIPLLAIAVYALGRLTRRRGLRFGPILVASALGLVSHPLLDAINSYGVRPYIPFDWTWYYGDMVFIVDPWLWLLFGGAACLAGPRRRNADAAWLVFAGLAAVFLFSAAGLRSLPLAFPAAWTALAAGVGGLRVRSIGLVQPRSTLRAFLLLAAVYFLALAFASREAERRGVDAIREEARRLGEPILDASANPSPLVPWRYDVVVETRSTLHRIRVDGFTGEVGEPVSIVRNLDDPILAAPEVEGSPEHDAWMRFARHRFAGYDEEGRLVLGDGRYTFECDPRQWCNLAPPMPE